MAGWLRFVVVRHPAALQVSQQLQEPSPDPEPVVGPTIFARFKTWRTAFEAWRGCLSALDVGAQSRELWLKLDEGEPVGRPNDKRHWRLHPRPTKQDVIAMRAHPGMGKFIGIAECLARAAPALLPILRRFGQPVEHAKALMRGLKKAPHLPSPAQLDAALRLRNQLVGVDDLISNGALSGEEDQRERRAHWDDEIANLKPTTDREAVEKALAGLLSSPRDPRRELAFLNGLRAREASDKEGAELQEIIDRDQSTPRGRYERWRELMKLGLVRYARDGKCHFRTSHTGRFYAAPGDPLPHDVRWATEMRAATDALHGPASDAEFPPIALQPIHELEMGLGEALDGHAVDLMAAFKAVNLIVAELLSRCPKIAGRRKGKAPAVAPQQLARNAASLTQDDYKILGKLNVADHGTMRTADLIAQVSGCGRRTIERRLAVMQKPAMGHVQNVQRGQWRITQVGRKALNSGAGKKPSATKRQSSA